MLDWVTFDFAAHAVWCQCLCMGCASSGDLAKHHLGVEGRVLGVLLDCCPSQARHGMASGWDVSELNCFFCYATRPLWSWQCTARHRTTYISAYMATVNQLQGKQILC
jgi:hypothetical protein